MLNKGKLCSDAKDNAVDNNLQEGDKVLLN